MTHQLTVGKVKGGLTENFDRFFFFSFTKHVVPLSDFRALNPFHTTGHFLYSLKTSENLLNNEQLRIVERTYKNTHTCIWYKEFKSG